MIFQLNLFILLYFFIQAFQSRKKKTIHNKKIRSSFYATLNFQVGLSRIESFKLVVIILLPLIFKMYFSIAKYLLQGNVLWRFY